MSILRVDKKDKPPHGNPLYVGTCVKPCGKEPCEDVREGEYPFTGPKTIHLKCEDEQMDVNAELEYGMFRKYQFSRTFTVYEDLGDGCFEPVTSVSKDSPAQLCCAKKYVIKYQWDNCLFDEPVFIESDPCC